MIRQLMAFVLCLCVLSGTAGPAFSQSADAGGVASAGALQYRINPGDELEILVWGDERLQKTVLVLPDGTFAFPLVGQVNAAGRLPSEIQQLIAAGLQPQYRGPVPQVTVSVSKATGYQFSVIGKVRSPGTFTPGRYVNALEALAIAGGPTEFASTDNIRVIRKVGGQLTVVPVRIANALRGNVSRITTEQIPRLESGDTLVVP